jgi:hypothetical protein
MQDHKQWLAEERVALTVRSPKAQAKPVNVTTYTMQVRLRFPWARGPRRVLQWLRGDDIGWPEENWNLHRTFRSSYWAAKAIRNDHERRMERAFLFGSDA